MRYSRRGLRVLVSTLTVLATALMPISPLALGIQVAQADNNAVDFESYALGTVNGQDGWSSLGAAGSGCAVYDHAIDSSLGTAGFGTKSLRISNAVTSGCFGDQTFSKSLVDEAGETGALNGGFSGGTRQPHFEAQFDIASTVPDAQQASLSMSVSPDRGDGARMSYLRFDDNAGGIDVTFYDVQGTSNPANFVPTVIATGLSRAVPHTVKFVMDFVDGPSNDIVKIYIDGVLVHTGTSWENYFRYDSESSVGDNSRTVDSLLFRTGGAAAPATSGKGYLIDNLSLLSGPTPAPASAQVHIYKYVDGKPATVGNTGGAVFPMETTFISPNLGSATNAPFTLSPTGWGSTDSAYEASFVGSDPGADYEADEVLGGAVVGATCDGTHAFMLSGYTTGDTLQAAAAATPSPTAPSFTNLQSDKNVIVWNRICLPLPVHLLPADGSTQTTASQVKDDWSDVTDPVGGITYLLESSLSPATNGDGSFTSPVYVSGPLSASEIPTPGTPAGTYYWHVKAVDADGNQSAWTTPWSVIVDNTPPPALLKVHVLKVLDGVTPTTVPGGYQFPMTATWQTANLNGGVSTTGTYVLGDNHGGATDLYGADTASMQAPANYTTSEITDSTSKVVASSDLCAPGKYLLNGYRTSAISFADAVSQTLTTLAPVFTGISTDQYVLVDNSTCPTVVLGSISGMKYNDLNHNGRKDIHEPGLPGWTIKLRTGHNTVLTTVTAADGTYTFANLPAGKYVVREVHQKGWKRMSKNPKPIVLAAGANVTHVTFGNAQKQKWEKDDTDNDDNRDDQPGFFHAFGRFNDYGWDRGERGDR